MLLHWFRCLVLLKSLITPAAIFQMTLREWSKGALSGLGQFLTTGSSLKIMENAFYFTLKTPFVLKMFKFLS